MWHIPKNVKPKKGLNIAYQFVQGSYVVKPDDLVRKTSYPNTYSDDINYDYVNAMNWESAKTCFPGWIGKTVDEIHKNLGKNYEIMRMVILKEDIE